MKILTTIATRWMLVVAFTLIGLVAAIGFSLLQPQTYVATVRTYIATGTSDMLEAYQGNQAARASIQTFAVLATDPVVAQRAIEKSGVDISLPQFLSEISVSVPPQTVILDVSVQNASSADAERLSTALTEELVGMVTALQEPTSGGPGALRLVIVDPNTQGAVRQQLIDPMLLGVGAVGGALAGAVLALLLQLRKDRRNEDEELLDAPGGPTTGDIEVAISRPAAAAPAAVNRHELPEPAPSDPVTSAAPSHRMPSDPVTSAAPSHRMPVEPVTSAARSHHTPVEPVTSAARSHHTPVEPVPSAARSRVETPSRPAVAPYSARHTVSRHSATR